MVRNGVAPALALLTMARRLAKLHKAGRKVYVLEAIGYAENII